MLGVRLDAETERALAEIARRTKRPKSQIARDAIRLYITQNDAAARARAQWKSISARERHDADMIALLDAAHDDFDRSL